MHVQELMVKLNLNIHYFFTFATQFIRPLAPPAAARMRADLHAPAQIVSCRSENKETRMTQLGNYGRRYLHTIARNKSELGAQ